MRFNGWKPIISSTLIMILLAVLVYAVTISIDTEGEFDAGTYVFTDYLGGGVISSAINLDSVLLGNQNNTEDVDMTDSKLVVYFDDSAADLLFGSEDVEDISGNAFHGEDYGTVSYAADGLFNKSLDMTSDSAIDFGDIEMDTWGEMTISIWIYRTSAGLNDRIVSKDRVGVVGNFYLKFVSNRLDWQVRDGGSWRTASYTPTNGGVDSSWHHVVATVNATSNQIELWWDGVSQNTAVFNAADLDDTDNEEVVVGADSRVGTFSEYFTGYVDDFAIWNRTLTSGEISTLYNAGIAESRSYTSSIQDAGSSTDWQTLLWRQDACYLCDLPDFSQNETVFSYNETIDMNQTIFLYHFDETTLNSLAGETDFYDSSGNFYHANETSGSVNVTDEGALFGRSLNLTEDGCVEVGFLNISNLTGFSVSAWYKSTDSKNQRIVGADPNGATGNFLLKLDDTPSTLFYDLDISGYRTANNVSEVTDDGEWHQLVGIVDTTQSKTYLYSDGELHATTDYTSSTFESWKSTDGGQVYVGCASNDQTQVFNGLIDEVAAWGRAISAEEVGKMYRRGIQTRNINFSVKSCNDAACDTEEFVVFEENSSPVDISSVVDNRYVQFQANFSVASEADLTRPVLYEVNVTSDVVSELTQVNGTAWSCPVGCRAASESPGYNAPGDFELYSPLNASSSTDRTPELQWNSSSGGSNPVTYQLQFATDEGFTDIVLDVSNIEQTNTSQTEYNVTSDLPYDDILYWRVRATDNTTTTAWTPYWQMEILSLVSISLPTSSVNFGTAGIFDSKNTSVSGGYQPMRIVNDGNIPLNITINATDFFQQPGGVYNFSIEDNITGSFSSAFTDWTVMNSSAQQAVTEFFHINGSNNANSVNLHLLISVPSSEPAGDKSSVIEVSNS